MNIAILGTRGIPNYYGGFEQFADNVSRILVRRGHNVYVYSSSKHPYQRECYDGVSLIHCKDPEDILGTAGQFIYDLNCIMDSRKRNFDIILQLGYTSSSIWGKLLPMSPKIITNMDGLEWKRTKFSKTVRKFIKFAERIAIPSSDFLVADSVGIQEHLVSEYGVESTYIPYGSEIFNDIDSRFLRKFNLIPYEYDMLVARLESENSIEEILDGYVLSKRNRLFLVIGNHMTGYGEYLKNKYKAVPGILFLGGIYDQRQLSNIRYFSNLYFHGHTVGGTNPSLLEAMGCSCLIVANQNIFNNAILQEDAFYFKTAIDISFHLNSKIKSSCENLIINNLRKIETKYSWEFIANQYENLFKIAVKA